MRTNSIGKASTRTMALLIVTAFIAVSIVPAMAGGHGPSDTWQGKDTRGNKHHRSALGIWRNPKLVQELELTDEQVNQLKEADFAAREKQLEQKTQFDNFRLQMDKAFSAGNVDEKAVRQVAEKIADIKGSLFVQGVESRLTVGKILSADQIDKLKLYKMSQKGKGYGQCNKSSSGHHRANQPCGYMTSSAYSE